MALFSDISDIDLEKQIASLSKELAALKKAAAKRGGGYLDEGRQAASDVYSGLADRIGDQLPVLRRRAVALEERARDHPAATAVAVVAVVGLLAALMLNRR